MSTSCSALSRRGFLQTSLALAQHKRKPNIVLFIYDDLGYGDLGCYGQQHILTPHSDRVAREGTRCTGVYAGGSVCGPSRSCLMTGLHTGHTPIRTNAGTVPLRDEDVTLPELLKQAGYATGGFGKWGLGDARTPGTPTRQGFDEFVGYYHQMHAHSYYPEYLWDGDRRLDLPKGTYSADVIAERAFQFLRRKREKPYFLYCPFTLPHAKFEGPDPKPYGDRPWPDGHKMYASMVTRADAYLGEILKLIDDNTLLLVTSDNGAHYGEEKGFEFFRSNGALRGQKGELYEGGLRVPMIARWPGRIAAGRVDKHPWAFWDLLPTLTEAAGARTPSGLDGRSMWPLLTGHKPPGARPLYWENCAYSRKENRLLPMPVAQAMRIGEWKAIQPKPNAPIEVYHLAKDPSETNDVAAAQPALVDQAISLFGSARTTPRAHDDGTFEWAK